MRIRLIWPIFFLASCQPVCGPTTGDERALPVTTERIALDLPSPEEARALADANNRFALALFSSVGSTGEGNVVLSNFTVFQSIAALGLGAEGDARDALARHLGGEPEVVAPRLNALANSMQRAGPASTLMTASRCWVDDGLPIKPQFVDAVWANLGVRVVPTDFGSLLRSPESEMAQWVSANTDGAIEGFPRDRSFSELTQLVLLSAFHFDADWRSRFLPSSTRPDTFHRLDGSNVEVPMMDDPVFDASIATMDGAAAVDLPFADPDFSMLFILPNDYEEFVGELTLERFEEIESKLEPHGAHVRLPRFEIEPQDFECEMRSTDSHLASCSIRRPARWARLLKPR